MFVSCIIASSKILNAKHLPCGRCVYSHSVCRKGFEQVRSVRPPHTADLASQRPIFAVRTFLCRQQTRREIFRSFALSSRSVLRTACHNTKINCTVCSRTPFLHAKHEHIHQLYIKEHHIHQQCSMFYTLCPIIAYKPIRLHV